MPKRVLSSKHTEKVFVVKRSDIFADGIWNGLKVDGLAKILKTISTNYKFLPRAQVEEDARWQQIIPYIVFENNGKIFLMKRKADHTDRRLANMYSIGVMLKSPFEKIQDKQRVKESKEGMRTEFYNGRGGSLKKKLITRVNISLSYWV